MGRKNEARTLVFDYPDDVPTQ